MAFKKRQYNWRESKQNLNVEKKEKIHDFPEKSKTSETK